MIAPPIGEGPRQCDFLFGAYKDQRPIMSQEKRRPLVVAGPSGPLTPQPQYLTTPPSGFLGQPLQVGSTNHATFTMCKIK